MTENSASILAIGNEILLGQIINKNASSLSKRLRDYHLRVDRHIVVEDSIEEIERGLSFAKKKSNIVFITGGLGPTNDDLTVEAVSKILAVECVFNKEVFESLVEKLNRREVRVSDNHKKQAYFLKGSEVICNDVGTAHGSYLKKDGFHYFILPGPPNEIDSCWQNFIDKKLKNDLSNKLSKEITSFHILGVPESEVADKMEKILVSYPSLKAEYRMHLPYIEIRFSYSIEEKQKIEELEKDIKKEFASFYFYKNESPIKDLFEQKWKNKKVLLVDRFSENYLGQRLQALNLAIDYYSCFNQESTHKIEGYDLVVELQKKDELILKANGAESIIKGLNSKRLRSGLTKKILSELALWNLVNNGKA